ncbi:MAG: O-antigen ligase family protein [Patescibacteria group bacterium]
MTGKNKNLTAKKSPPRRTPNWTLLYNIVAYIYLAAFVIGIIYFSFSPLIFILFVVVAAIFILPLNSLGLGIIVCLTMIFERFFTLQSLVIEQAAYKIYPLDLVILITGLALLINIFYRKSRPKLFLEAPEKILLLFMALTGLYFLRGLIDINADPAVVFSSFKNYAFYPILYFLVIYIIQDSKKFKNLIHIMILSGLALIVFIAIGFFRGQGLWTEFTPLSTGGVRLLAGTHAFYLVLTFLIILSLLAAKRFYNNSLPSLVLWLWGLGIAVSLMRHLWLALVVGALVLLFIAPKTNRKKLIGYGLKNLMVLASIVVLVVLVVNLLPLQGLPEGINNYGGDLKERVVSILNTAGDTSASWRISLWQTAQRVWLLNPFLGVGFGLKIPLELPDWHTFEEVRNIHNSLLAILVQMGIIGLLLFLLVIATVLAKSWKKIFLNEDLNPYYLGLVACLTALIFASLFQPYLETNLTGVFFWLILGLIRTGKIINNQKLPAETNG